jgi:hypothetical protein
MAVATVPAVGLANAPSWQTDYTAAQERAIAVQKPLAVVFGPGENGWQQIGGGKLPAEAAQMLSDKYVCVFVDTSTPAGKEMATKFEIAGSVGLVISDRTGSKQAFWHQGTLPADTLASYLSRYADPQRPLVTTETNRYGAPISYYPPQGYSPWVGGGSAMPCRS